MTTPSLHWAPIGQMVHAALPEDRPAEKLNGPRSNEG